MGRLCQVRVNILRLTGAMCCAPFHPREEVRFSSLSFMLSQDRMRPNDPELSLSEPWRCPHIQVSEERRVMWLCALVSHVHRLWAALGRGQEVTPSCPPPFASGEESSGVSRASEGTILLSLLISTASLFVRVMYSGLGERK